MIFPLPQDKEEDLGTPESKKDLKTMGLSIKAKGRVASAFSLFPLSLLRLEKRVGG